MTIQLGSNVQQALETGSAVVALESTIITHGMPYPDNLETAKQVQDDIRAEGALAATIAVLDGVLTIGLTDGQLERMARLEDVLKLSRADLAYAMATGKSGSTTVAATMLAASQAGIAVFATGGIGGVHRDVTDTFDISADLQEFTRSNVTVVCAGCKAILDIGRTVEYLETHGIPVITWQADELPAFWSSSSGIPSPLRIDSEDTWLALIQARQHLQQTGGILLNNPIPEQDGIPFSTIERWIDAALQDARSQGMTGKSVTPFLLQRINELSDGRSLKANIALIRNNARLAARLAVRRSTRLATD